MKTANMTIEILDYWHAGTGAGLGPIADAEPVKDGLGLPFLPGKTLRGLLRDVCELAEAAGHELWPTGSVDNLFGRRAKENQDTTDGLLHVTSAKLDDKTRAWLETRDDSAELAAALFKNMAHTAIDPERGVVKDKSLRVVELAVPLCLNAKIEGPDDENWQAALGATMPLLRGMGTSRRRGFGRMSCAISKEA